MIVTKQTQPIKDQFSIQLNNFRVQFTLFSQQFNIKLTSQEKYAVFSAQLTKPILNQLDPSIMLTFGTIECMYKEIVEIAKSNEDININENGIIKLRINISLKSGVQHKDLVLETQRRDMKEMDFLEIKIRNQGRRADEERQKLLKKIRDLQRELDKAQKQRGKLVQKIDNQKKEFQQQIQELKKKMNYERSESSCTFQEMKEEIRFLKEEVKSLKEDMSLLMDRSTKLKMRVNKKSKCIQSHQKLNYFQFSSKYIEKKGPGWTQVLFSQPASLTFSNFYDIYVNNTKNYYICLGYAKKSCLEQLDSKWNKEAVTLFLLDSSILCEGKKVREEGLGIKVKKEEKIRVRFDPVQRKIVWLVNNKQMVCVEVSEDFVSGEVYPLIICCDEGDRIDLA